MRPSFGTKAEISSSWYDPTSDPADVPSCTESRLGGFFNVFRAPLVLLEFSLSASSHGGEADSEDVFPPELVREGRRRVREVLAGWPAEMSFRLSKWY